MEEMEETEQIKILSIAEYYNLHGKIILGSRWKREVGDIIVADDRTEIRDTDHSEVTQPFVVVREATLDEFIAQQPELLEQYRIYLEARVSEGTSYYYEVRTD